MNTPLRRAVGLGLAIAACGAAAAELIPLQWSADGTFVKDVAVPAGKFVEACGKLPARAEVDWSFEAAGPLDFNIHFHEGEKVRFPARQNQVASASGKLDAQSAQDYCWMWTNKGASEAALRLKLARRQAPARP